MKMYRIGFVLMAFALGAMFAATNARAQGIYNPEQVSSRYDFSSQQAFAPFVKRATRRVVRNLHPRQVVRNTKAVIQAPVELIDKSFDWFKRRAGKNMTGFTCLGCGREQRLYNINHGYRDCAGGDHVNGWFSPACTTHASAGQIGSLRITSRHIERVIGKCAGGVLIGDGNGPYGRNSVRCVTIAGASYRMPIPSEGPVKVLYMQPDPCHGRGRGPKDWAGNSHAAFGIAAAYVR